MVSKTIKVMSLASLLLASPIQAQSLYDKVKDLKKSELKSQYILKEDQLLSYAREFEIEGKSFIEYYIVVPRPIRMNNNIVIPIGEKPYWYFYDGKHYEDKEMDGLNGNEVEKKLNEPL